MLVKIHESYRQGAAICDSDLIGKKLEDGEIQMDLTGNFFKGDEKTPEEVKEIIVNASREDANFNIVGEESCKLALEQGLIEEHGIKKIKNIPVALVLL